MIISASGALRPRTSSAIRCWAALLLLLAVALLPAEAAQAAPAGLSWSATIGDRDAATVQAGDPLQLGSADPATAEPTRIVVTFRNDGPEPLRVKSVRLDGRVMGLTFFSYTTGIDLELAPGTSASRRLDVDLGDLTAQARGLVPARLMLIAPDRSVIDSKNVPVDIHGSWFSVYNLFGIAVAAITAVLIISLLWALRRNALPANRWRRGLRFAAVGLGIGLTLTFSLSSLGLLLPSATRWVTLVVIFTGGAFLLGYLLPGLVRPAPTPEQAPAPSSAPSHRVGSP